MRVCGVAAAPQGAKYLLHIPQVIDQVGEDNVIKSAIHFELVRVHLQEFHLGVILPGDGDHFRAKIHAQPARRLEAGEKIASPAAELQDRRTFGDEEAEEFRQTAVIGFSSRPALCIAGDVVPVLHPLAGVKFLFCLGHTLSTPVASSSFTFGWSRYPPYPPAAARSAHLSRCTPGEYQNRVMSQIINV